MTGGPIGRNIYFDSFSCSLAYSNNPPYCVFPSLADDMHIIGLASDVVFVFLRL
jgi:hypothetical protein